MAKPIKHGKGYRIRWIDETGTRQSACFQTYSEANEELKLREAKVVDIASGRAQRIDQSVTFNQLCDAYLAAQPRNKKNLKSESSVIKCHIRPALGVYLIKDVEQHVGVLRSAISHLGSKTQYNVMTVLIAMLNWAVTQKWLASCPKIKKPKIDMASDDYRYLKTEREIAEFLEASRAEGDSVYYLYLTAIYSGLREGELAGLKWEHVDFQKRLITVKHSYDGVTKNGKSRKVPIFDVLLGSLKEWRLKSPSNVYVFSNERGGMQQRSARIFQEVLHRVLDRAGFPNTHANGITRRYVVFHDLRHTFASHFMMNGGNLFKLSKILGHQSITMTQRYSHLAPTAYTEDYSRFNRPNLAAMG